MAKENLDRLQLERLQALVGESPKAPELAAVRIKDLSGILTMTIDLESKMTSNSGPTHQEFNALVRDVHNLHKSLKSVMEALGRRSRA